MKLRAEVIDSKDLTPRESDVFELLCSGEPNKGISNALCISIKVVEKHIDHIYEKLGIRWQSVNKRSAAVLIVIHRGMIKTVVNSIFAVLIFQAVQVPESGFIRAGVRLPRVVKVRGKYY